MANAITCPHCLEPRARLIEVSRAIGQRPVYACDVCTAINRWEPAVKATVGEALDELIGYIRLVNQDPETYAWRGHLGNALQEVERRLDLLAVIEA